MEEKKIEAGVEETTQDVNATAEPLEEITEVKSEPVKEEEAPVLQEKKVQEETQKQTLQSTRKTRPAVKTGKRSSSSMISHLIEVAVQKNGGRNNVRLKTHLTGVIQIIVTGATSYVFDWRGDDLKVTEGQVENPDCTIEMKAGDLVDAINGDLNIQIAILSDKVKLSGDAGMALYLFNLFN